VPGRHAAGRPGEALAMPTEAYPCDDYEEWTSHEVWRQTLEHNDITEF
jgi:hypothetical protein